MATQHLLLIIGKSKNLNIIFNITALFLLFFHIKSYAATYTVTNTNDSGSGSLRQAITDANSTYGPDKIEFNISASDVNYNSTTGVWSITPLTELPMVMGGYTTIDACTQTTNQGNTNASGPEIILDGSKTLIYAFRIVSPNNTIKGFVLGRFDYAIQIYGTLATGNSITQNYIGTDATGVSSFSNNYGVGISGNASSIQITDNVISANTVVGIATSPANQITITGNKIGTDVSGTTALANATGIILDNSSYNTIGGPDYSTRNIISGNTDGGILINGTGSSGNTILGNFIGTNNKGTSAIPNGNGVMVVSASNNTIGSETSSARNIISGNSSCGILLNGTGTNDNIIIGNYIGLDSSGTMAISNHYGIIIKADADKNRIGGTSSSERNVISANWEIGVYIEASDSNQVSGNFIGPDYTGKNSLNVGDTLIQANGIEMNTLAKYNTVGGTTSAERNIISGNRVYGAILYGQASENTIAGNYIGTDMSGMYSIPNATGICVDDASNNNIMENNVLSGNVSYGIFIVTTGSNYNIFRGNLVGCNVDGTDTVPNDVGMLLAGGAKYNLIGGSDPSERNIFSGNHYGGIEITDNGTDYNEIIGNYIGTDMNGTNALPNYFGIGLSSLSTGTLVENNVISGNNGFGLVLTDQTDSNTVIGNLIGIAKDGMTDLGNKACGIALTAGTKNNFIGSLNKGNFIAYNDSAGIVIYDNATTNNKIFANSIFENDFLGIDIYPWGVNSNDEGDDDIGPNNMINFPLITSSGYDAALEYAFISGTLETSNPQNCTIEIFKANPDLSFNHGEGAVYLGSTKPDDSGNWSIVVSGLVDEEEVTATATDQNGNTSEFSLNTTTVVGINESPSANINADIFPNPAYSSAILSYYLNQPGYVEFNISDITGKTIQKFCEEWQSTGNYQIKLNFEDEEYSSGIYFVKIITESKNTSLIKLEVIK